MFDLWFSNCKVPIEIIAAEIEPLAPCYQATDGRAGGQLVDQGGQKLVQLARVDRAAGEWCFVSAGRASMAGAIPSDAEESDPQADQVCSSSSTVHPSAAAAAAAAPAAVAASAGGSINFDVQPVVLVSRLTTDELCRFACKINNNSSCCSSLKEAKRSQNRRRQRENRCHNKNRTERKAKKSALSLPAAAAATAATVNKTPTSDNKSSINNKRSASGSRRSAGIGKRERRRRRNVANINGGVGSGIDPVVIKFIKENSNSSDGFSEWSVRDDTVSSSSSSMSNHSRYSYSSLATSESRLSPAASSSGRSSDSRHTSLETDTEPYASEEDDRATVKYPPPVQWRDAEQQSKQERQDEETTCQSEAAKEVERDEPQQHIEDDQSKATGEAETQVSTPPRTSTFTHKEQQLSRKERTGSFVPQEKVEETGSLSKKETTVPGAKAAVAATDSARSSSNTIKITAGSGSVNLAGKLGSDGRKEAAGDPSLKPAKDSPKVVTNDVKIEKTDSSRVGYGSSPALDCKDEPDVKRLKMAEGEEIDSRTKEDATKVLRIDKVEKTELKEEIKEAEDRTQKNNKVKLEEKMMVETKTEGEVTLIGDDLHDNEAQPLDQDSLDQVRHFDTDFTHNFMTGNNNSPLM